MCLLYHQRDPKNLDCQWYKYHMLRTTSIMSDIKYQSVFT